MPDKSAKRPRERKEKRPAKRRLGLAGRVTLIAICAALVATLAQWIATPILAQGEVRRQQDALTDGLPGGQSAVFDADWKLIARDGATSALPPVKSLQDLAADREAVLDGDGRVFAARVLEGATGTLGYAVFSFEPRPALQIWLGIVLLNAMVLVVALAVLAQRHVLHLGRDDAFACVVHL